jgi:hypothetical protein
VRIPKLLGTSLVGLALNAVFNGFYLLLIARESDSQLLAQSMVMWAGFFVAGACIAPFENYRLYRQLGEDGDQSQGKILGLISFLFVGVGVSIYISQDQTLWVLPIILAIGLCVGMMVSLRAYAISQAEMKTVSISNAAEGVTRFACITFFIFQFEEITFLHVLISYLIGNIVSLTPYARKRNLEKLDKIEPIPTSRLYGLAVVGLSTAHVTGGLPYLAGYFEANSISTILFFYTLTRSLLIIQSILVYVRPQLAKELGEENPPFAVFKNLVLVLLLTHVLILILKYGLETIFEFDLSQLGLVSTFLFAISIVLNAYFALRIAAKNVSIQWWYGLISSCLSLLTAFLCFTLIDSSKFAFYCAMILAPLVGIVTSFQKRSSYFTDCIHV